MSASYRFTDLFIEGATGTIMIISFSQHVVKWITHTWVLFLDFHIEYGQDILGIILKQVYMGTEYPIINNLC